MSNQCSGKDSFKESQGDTFGKLACIVASTSGKPITFLLAVAVIVVWAVSGPIFKFNDTWQLVINTGTTIVTFLMVFLIQNTQNRESVAVQLKLDEIIRAIDAADNEKMSLEEKSQDELETIKGQYTQMASEAKVQVPENKM
jgi:Predicted small integral membrane protein